MKILIPMATALALLIPSISTAEEVAVKLSEEDRRLIINEVVSYFKENPAELVEAIIDWREKTEKAVNTPEMPFPVSGNPSGDVTIFEFPDYGCKACNVVSTIIDKVASEDRGVGIVHHDLPRVGGTMSVQASSEIIAVNAAGADWQHLRRTFIRDGIQPETRLQALDELGMNHLNLDTPSAMKNIRKNNEIAKKTGIEQLPALVVAVGDKVQVLHGNISEPMVLHAIRDLRRAALQQ